MTGLDATLRERPRWTRAEALEAALIAAAAGAVFLAWGGRVWTPALGKAVGYGAALLLGQGLVRDLTRLAWRRARGEARRPGRRIACLCAESTVGLALVGAAVGLTLLGVGDTVTLGRASATLAALGVLTFGLVAKDYVVSVRRETDHASVIVFGGDP